SRGVQDLVLFGDSIHGVGAASIALAMVSQGARRRARDAGVVVGQTGPRRRTKRVGRAPLARASQARAAPTRGATPRVLRGPDGRRSRDGHGYLGRERAAALRSRKDEIEGAAR